MAISPAPPISTSRQLAVVTGASSGIGAALTAALELCVALAEAQARIALAMEDTLGAWHGLAWRDFALVASDRMPAASGWLLQGYSGRALACAR